MDKLSPEELKSWYRFASTELGQKVLATIDELSQAYVDRAILNVDNGPQATHDYIVAASAVVTVKELIKPPEKPEEIED